ncbi:MAG TPA: NAD-dependent epimerase/dehydratase family protein [Rhizomicrobium sp.]|nr:NAD-dependent epimerase/dehydratase family protein [Rhizomicrobium sp.]
MRILILGGDGYLGWATAMCMADLGHNVLALDNYLRRQIAGMAGVYSLVPTQRFEQRAQIFRDVTGKHIETAVLDCRDIDSLRNTVSEFGPDAIVHYAELPSAPFSMAGYGEANLTLTNNLTTTFNVIWSIVESAPDCHLIKLGTLGEYGTPNIDIEEGWLQVDHKGRSQKFLYPREGGSLYHTSKIMETDLLWFYARTRGLRVTDLMQGPVYGISTEQTRLDPRLATNLYYDDVFGTVLNRFVVQALAGIPLTVYGNGCQKRGFLNIVDTLQCVTLASTSPPPAGELRILNQFTEVFSVAGLARLVQEAAARIGISATIQHLDNPRKEQELHYYNPSNKGFADLGLVPTALTADVVVDMMEEIRPYTNRIDRARILPTVNWSRRDG